MEWTQVLVLIASNFGLFLWVRNESSADRREIAQILREIKDEQKDFHGRLCAIEERNRK